MRYWHLKKYRVGKKWRWRLRGLNGRIVAASSESFSSLERCEKNVELTLRGLLACIK